MTPPNHRNACSGTQGSLTFYLAILIFPLFAIYQTLAAPQDSSDRDWVGQYDLEWTTPSLNSAGSMPLSGIRGSGANVWLQDGSIWLYLAHAAAYDQNHTIRKLGCLRLTPASGPLICDKDFSQKLELESGSIVIHARTTDQASFDLKLWFDPASGILHLDSTCGTAQSMKVEFGIWDGKKDQGMMHNDPGTLPYNVSTSDGIIRWVHLNKRSETIQMPKEILAKDVEKEGWSDPAADCVFGGAIASLPKLTVTPNPTPVHWQSWSGRAWSGTTEPASQSISIAVAVDVDHTEDASKWQATIDSKVADSLNPEGMKKGAEANHVRWADYWNRSWIVINPRGSLKDRAYQCGKNYALFRYMRACNQGGTIPLKFNGGIFTVEPWKGNDAWTHRVDDPAIQPYRAETPDFRLWGSLFFGQNQRWLGWPGLMAGDPDTSTPTYEFYLRNLPVAKAACEINMKHPGAIFPEVLTLDGRPGIGSFNWTIAMGHLRWHHSMMVEEAWMALEFANYYGLDPAPSIPMAEAVLRFYDEHFRQERQKEKGKELDDKGRLVIYPVNGLELLGGATNPVEVVAGLHRIVDRILSLPETSVPKETREFFKKVKPTLPELPVSNTASGEKILLPAAGWEAQYNKDEFNESYTLFPYRMTGVTEPDTLPMMRSTWKNIPADRAEHCKQDISWQPTLSAVALMGMTDEAHFYLLNKWSDSGRSQRFPAFFGPGHDWIPDHNWGGSGMVGLQSMLMAAAGKKIVLFPAWPANWDVDFKLHAPEQTTVECQFRDGKIQSLVVVPESRRKDVEIRQPVMLRDLFVPPKPDIHLSDLPALKMENGNGRATQNRSIGGNPLRVAGETYPKGLGCHARSLAVYAIPPKASRFVALAGIDDEVAATGGSVTFEVYGDTKQPGSQPEMLASSPVIGIKNCKGRWAFDLPLKPEFKELRLVVNDGGDGIAVDHADWVDVGFVTGR